MESRPDSKNLMMRLEDPFMDVDFFGSESRQEPSFFSLNHFQEPYNGFNIVGFAGESSMTGIDETPSSYLSRISSGEEIQYRETTQEGSETEDFTIYSESTI